MAWSSAGAKGFKGSRKSTPYAAQIAADDAAGKAQEHGIKTLSVRFGQKFNKYFIGCSNTIC